MSCTRKLVQTYFIWMENTNPGLKLVIFILFEQFILSSIQKQKKKQLDKKSRSEACESKVGTCEHVKKC